MTNAPTDYLVAPTLRLDKGEGLAEALRCLREFDPRVFMIFGGDAEDVQWLQETLEEQAGHPILFAADLERGAGQQFDGLTPLPDAWALGLLGPEASYDAGHRTAAEAATAGVRWILGPVLDLHRMEVDAARSPIIANRAFGGDLERVVECAGAFTKGLTDAGGIPCGKHFPGHGGCTQDSHTEMAVCFEDIGPHLEPFRELLDQLPTLMVGHVEFPMIEPDGGPASRSKTIMDMLRREMGYDGLVVTDSVRMTGFGEGDMVEMCAQSLRVGVDLLLDPEDPVGLAKGLRMMMQTGHLEEERVFEAVGRVDKLIRRALDTETAAPRPLMLGGGAKRLLHPLPGGAPRGNIQRPACALDLASTPDAIRYLEEWDVPVFTADAEPPTTFPGPLLVLCGAREGRGLPEVPGAWLEAIHHHHPALFVAGAPEAAAAVPSSARGWHLPGLSPALLGLLLTAGAEV